MSQTSLTDATPCLVRETLYAPQCPVLEIANLLEAALTYHNCSKYKMAVDMYLKAREKWCLQMTPGEELPPEVDIYFMNALGSVYESAEQDDVALLQYQEAKLLAEELPSYHPDISLSYSNAGAVYVHMGQYSVALEHFEKALNIRQTALGQDHVDAALLYNNVAVCLDLLGRSKEALGLYEASLRIFTAALGADHPRAFTVSRNVAKCKRRIFPDYAPTVPPVPDAVVRENPPTRRKGKKKGGPKKRP